MTETKGGGGLGLVGASRAKMAARDAAALAPVMKARAAAQDTIVSARMVAAELQPHTIAGRAHVATVVEHVAIEVDRNGATHLERSAVTALFNRDICAVMRLAHDGLIDATGVKAALRFAWAGDRVMGQARIRTVDLDRMPGGDWSGMQAAERDAQARIDWDVATLRLMARERRILDGVMRRDESAHAAAQAAYPQIRSRDKLQGMGDQALISATEKLAVEYGYKAQNERVVSDREKFD